MILAVDNWTRATTLATVLATLVVSASAPLVLLQLRETKRTRLAEATWRLVEHLDMGPPRDLIYKLGDVEAITDGQWATCWDEIRPVSLVFNRLGLLLEHGLIDESIVFDMYCVAIVEAWDRLGPYVTRESKRRGFIGYQRQFRHLAERATAYARSHPEAGPDLS